MKHFLLLFAGCFSFLLGKAQSNLEIQFEIFEPYPVNLEYYLNNAGNIFLSITNTAATDREIYFHTRITGNNGLEARTKDGYKPAQPTVIPAFQTVVFTGFDLETTDFGFNSLGSVDFFGVTPELQDIIVFNRALPEGTYQICLRIFDWNTDLQRAVSCTSEFSVYYGDMPFIYLPFQGEEVPANPMSHVTIAWEPPFTLNPVPGGFEYSLKMIDITGQPFNDLEILMNDPGQFPLLDITGIIDLVYNYDYPPEIELIEGHQYALRVRAVDPSGTTPVTNNGYSEIVTFWYGYEPGQEDLGAQGGTSTQSDCQTDCLFPNIRNTNPAASIAGFNTLSIGYFELELQTLSNESGNSASGTGAILLPFLDSIRVNVEFDGVKVNPNGRIYEGNVYAREDYTYDPNNPVSVSGFDQFLRTERLISAALGGSGRALNLPIGIVWELNGEHLMLGFSDMTFTPERASCQVMYNMHYPHWNEFWLSLSASDICLLPSGFGQEFVLHPVMDVPLPDIGDTRYTLKGTLQTELDSIKAYSAYVDIDCKGVRDFGTRIEVEFSRDVFVPDLPDGSPGTGRVRGIISTSFPRTIEAPSLGEDNSGAELGFLGGFSMEPFQVKGLPGIGFTLNEGWVDFSDTRNPAGMTIPSNYNDDNVVTQNGVRSLDPLWEGFYMKSLSVRSAEDWLFEDQRLQFEVADMIFDDLLTAKIRVSNIADGYIDNWYLSLDTFYIELVQWSINNTGTWNVGLNGRLGIPITGDEQYLQYSAFIQPNYESNLPDMEFLVQPPEGLTFPFMQTASASICPNSYVQVLHQSSATQFNAQLAGNVAIGLPDPISITIPWIDFQFAYHSQMGFSNYAFSVLGQPGIGEEVSCDNLPPPSSLEGGVAGSGGSGGGFPAGTPVSANGFPMSINLLDIIQIGGINQVNFNIDPRIELGGGGQNGFGADFDLQFKSRMNSQSRKLAFDGIDLGRIEVNVEEVFGININGVIDFYKEGNDQGARGELNVNLPLGISTELKADFGVRMNRFDVPFGTEDFFGYWYVDGMVGFPGVPIVPGIHLHGLGGGVYVNMRRQDSFDNSNAKAVQDLVNELMADIPNTEFSVASTPDKLRPVVEYGQFGLKLATRLATTVPSALNMDVSIAGGFAPGIGINNLSVQGDAYMMTSFEKRSLNANFWASAGFSWNKDGSGHRFAGGIELFANVGNGLLKGVGPNSLVINASFLADTKGTWYFHAGSPKVRAGLEIDILIAKLQANGYFMVGHHVPSTLPIPTKVLDLMGRSSGRDDNRLNNQNPVTGARARDGSTEDSRGIAFGFETSTSVDIRAWALYAKLETVLGFDVNLTEQVGSTCYIKNKGLITDPGVNGWYATGQIYAGLEGAMGLKGKFLGKEREFELFQMAAAMLLSAGGPNPTWAEGRAGASYRVLNGLIKGSVNFDIRAGDRCVPDSDDENLIPVVYDLSPEDGEEDVSIFASNDILATFMLPINEIITVPIIHPITRQTQNVQLEIYIDTLYVRNEQSGQVWQGTRTWSQDKQAVTLNTGSWFSPETPHKVHLRVKAWQHIGSSKIPLLQDGVRTHWKEERMHTFTTGTTPYPIPDDQILKTLPIRNQRYFLQDAKSLSYLLEAPLILATANMSDAGYFPASEGNNDYEYYFRWASLNGSEPQIIDANHLAGMDPVQLITSRLPRLDNDTYYSCQLVRKTIRYRTVNLPEGGTMRIRIGSEGMGISDQKLSVAGAGFAGTGMSRADTLSVDINIDPGQFVGEGEEIIYQFYFKTSKFNTLAGKMASANIIVEEATHSLSKYPVLRFDMEENFDAFDIEGEYSQTYGGNVSFPRVEFSSVIGTFQPTYRQQLVANVNNYGYGTVVNAWVQDDYQHQGGRGKIGYSDYLSQSLVGFVQLYEEAESRSHAIVLQHGSEPARTIQSNFPVFNGSTLRGNYYGNQHTFYMRERRAAGYDPPLSQAEIQSVWQAYVNSNIYPVFNQRVSNFTLEYYIPIWVAQDIQDVTAFGADLLSRTYLWDAGNLGGGGLGGHGSPGIISSGGSEGGVGNQNILQTQEAGVGSGTGGGIIIVATGNMGGGGGGSGYVPPTYVNHYRNYIHTYYPALQTQLDIMNDSGNYYRLEKHRGSYDIRLQPDIGYLIETRVPGAFTTRNFSYSVGGIGGGSGGFNNPLPTFTGPIIQFFNN
jgi:hypothetical protein